MVNQTGKLQTVMFPDCLERSDSGSGFGKLRNSRGALEPARVRPSRQNTPAGTRDFLGDDCCYEARRSTIGIMCRFARASISGSVTEHVYIAVRGSGLIDTMSKYLIWRIEQTPNITVLMCAD